MSNWTDAIIGDRMAVDQEFTDRVQASAFSSQEWGLIMTATELEMEQPDDPEQARIVANTENVESVLPELEAINNQMPMGGSPGRDNAADSGLIGTLKQTLGFGGSESDDAVDEERLAAAEALTQEYADALQEHLEANDKFQQAREAYQAAGDSSE